MQWSELYSCFYMHIVEDDWSGPIADMFKILSDKLGADVLDYLDLFVMKEQMLWAKQKRMINP